MTRDDPPEQSALRAAAESQYPLIRDRQVYDCWHVVVEAVTRTWIDLDSLEVLIGELSTGGGFGAQEFFMEVRYAPDGASLIAVSFLGEHYECPQQAMLAELRRLVSRACGTEPDSADPIGLLESLAALAEQTPDTATGRAARQEALAALEQWSGTTGDPAAEGTIGAAVTRLSETDKARLAQALAQLGDWFGNPDPASGRRMDALIRALERGLGPLLTRGRLAEDQATRRRITATARDSIARRLRESGAENPKDPPA